MATLRGLIAELTEEVATSTVAAITRELLDKFFGEFTLPMPALKFVNKANAKALATCKWYAGSDNTEMEIQKSVLGDKNTLRRVIAHELIHHWQYLRTDMTKELAFARVGIPHDGHGEDFMGYAAKINAVMGAGYVSKESDRSYDTSKVPPYYILIQPHGSGLYGYSIAVRPSAKQKDEIKDRVATKQAKLFKITDGRLFSGASPIKKYGGYAVPKDPSSPGSTMLRDLYEKGTQASL